MPGCRGSGAYFGPGHPVAEVARRRCRRVHPEFGNAAASRWACGGCWEHAVRADERVVVLFDLPSEVVPDPSYVDVVAVELACAGERVPLTWWEFGAAARRLRARGMAVSAAADRLRTSVPRVVAATTPFVEYPVGAAEVTSSLAVAA